MPKFEVGKTYPLRGGGYGEVFAAKNGILYGRGRKKDDKEFWPSMWSLNGRYWNNKTPGESDLIIHPSTVTIYVNVYAKQKKSTKSGCWHTDPKKAIAYASEDAIAVAVPVTFTFGPDGKIEVTGGVE